MLLLLQAAVAPATSAAHPLSGTAAEWLWLLPLLPLLGFVVNGVLSLNSVRFGPGDPNTPGHHPRSEAAADAPAISHAGVTLPFTPSSYPELRWLPVCTVSAGLAGDGARVLVRSSR